ncbi:uncharacterized protein PHACADRAFT_147173 [Phanerochaete carnosa HHB-10118-sp]|uniref:Peptidase A1 domain-containing protein n=1 Tax=Phanerochaete carnosa (strain HHB-10118-sp) TaxID=650164 RepID=K5W6Y0_PHACS|nr:uncharacterized protein PHACADRAFT_147173 [Phanerochaete carnosa HHB-10118-sp]EKM54900.1 hypothetical protein PHACADRAFT_147173 [Phanerochaete carnosa HHB-10118-sp]
MVVVSLIVDTGSSNTWVGANSSNPYTPTSTSYDTGDPVYVAYGTGFFIGTEFIDQVSLGEGFTISQQSIGVANASADFNGTDGILGIGPTDLTADTVRNSGLVPTVFDNAFTQGLIDKKIMSIFFEPTNGILEQNGELTFGGIDESKFTGNITFVNITTTSPSNQYYGINQTVHYGNTTILDNKAGIVDTGTSLFLLATEAFNTYQQLTGGVMNETLGLLSITPQQYENLQSLFLEIGGRRFELTRNAQIFPRSLNTAIGGTADSIYLVVAGTGTPLGEGLDFLNGQVMLERFFLVIDAENSQVGLATTQFTNATTN